MAIEKKESFIKQIALYLNHQEYQKAHDMAKEFANRFSSDLISYYLLAKTAFWVGKYEEALDAGKKAFNMATGKELVPCAIIVASAYYQLHMYDKGYEILNYVKTKELDIEKLKFAFALAMNDKKKATDILDMIFEINKKETYKLLKKILVE